MKHILCILACVLFTFTTYAQGIDFFHGTWDEALQEAEKQEKLIFVDGYAAWCGPCKRMARSVFTKKEVGDFYNSNYINMKLDLEKGEGKKFRKKYPVSAFPTLFFIDSKGKVVHKQKGALPVDRFIKLGQMVLGRVDNSADFAKAYEAGDRDPELIFKYVKALNKAGKPSLKIANDYLNAQKDLTTDFNLKFIKEAAVEADSRIFDLLTKYRKEIAALTSVQAVNDQIERACNNTLNKALEFKNRDLLKEAQAKMKTNLPEKAAQFTMQSDLNFCVAAGDAKNYTKCAKKYVKKEVKNDAKRLHSVANDIKKAFKADAKAMKFAEKVASKAAENGGEHQYYFTYADILNANGKKDAALKAANRSLELADKDKRAQMRIQKLINAIKAG